MSQSQPERKLSKKEAVDILWRNSNLQWKLDSNQKEIYNFINNTAEKVLVVAQSRQTGKSFTLTTLAIETCLKKPNTIVVFIAPKIGQIRGIIKPLVTEITKDIPKDLKPEYKTLDKMYRFPNGSEIQLAGTDNGNAEKIRGLKAHLCIIDEAGFCNDLNYIVNSILIPTTTTTGGKIIMISTPSRSPDHDFMSLWAKAESENRSIKRTIYDCPRMTEKEIKINADAAGGYESVDFRREYLVERIISQEDAVIPEFTQELQSKIIKEWPRPPFYDIYAAMDIGGKDMTVVLFAYYDFASSKIIIEDEIVMIGNQMVTDTLANLIKSKEQQLWTSQITGEQKAPHLRVADNNNLILLNDLQIKHQINFLPTAKDNKIGAINNLRMLIRQEQVIINPKCKTLIYHLSSAVWNKQRDSYIRSSDKGHFDACFLPGTSIMTSSGAKNIEDIKPGDLVLTHKGNFKKVIMPLSRDYSGYIYEMDIPGRLNFSCTIDHKFWTEELIRTNNKFLTGQLTAHNPEWRTAEELIEHSSFRKKHAFKLPEIQNKKQLNISNEMCFLQGYYVAEGSLGGNGSQIGFAGHKKEKNVMKILDEALRKEYGYDNRGTSIRSKRRHGKKEFNPRKISAPIFIEKNGNSRNIIISNRKLYLELKKLKKSVNKKFPDWIYQLDENQAFYMICGYLFGDGHFSKNGIISNTISKDICYGLEILYLICGISSSIGWVSRKNQGHNPQFNNKLTKEISLAILNKINTLSDLAFVFKDKLIHKMEIELNTLITSHYKTLANKELKYYIGKVYSMEVEDDHSYMVNGVPAKNCDALTYLCRNVDLSKNPYPANYHLNMANRNNIFDPGKEKPKPANQVESAFQKQFTVRKWGRQWR